MHNRAGDEVPIDSSAARASGGMSRATRDQLTCNTFADGCEDHVQPQRNNEPDECSNQSGHEPGERTATDGNRTLIALLIEIGRKDTAAHDPQTTTVTPTDDWKCGQDTDEQSAEKRRLKHGVTLAACRASSYRRGQISRSTRGPSA